METVRLLFFTALWTAVWGAALPQLSRRVELIAGLIPFTAFGLRVFAACFLGVPEDDPVRRAVAPLVDWVNGVSGVPPYQWVLDVTVAIAIDADQKHSRYGYSKVGVDVAIDKLDDRQRGVVAVAEASFQDAGVAALAVLVALCERIEELHDDIVFLELGSSETTVR